MLQPNAGDGINHVARIKVREEHKGAVQKVLLEKSRNNRVEGETLYVQFKKSKKVNKFGSIS